MDLPDGAPQGLFENLNSIRIIPFCCTSRIPGLPSRGSMRRFGASQHSLDGYVGTSVGVNNG